MSDRSSFFVYRELPFFGIREYAVFPGGSTWTQSTYYARAFTLAYARLLVTRLEKKNTPPYFYGYVEA